jgi:hypothetical protein
VAHPVPRKYRKISIIRIFIRFSNVGTGLFNWGKPYAFNREKRSAGPGQRTVVWDRPRLSRAGFQSEDAESLQLIRGYREDMMDT